MLFLLALFLKTVLISWTPSAHAQHEHLNYLLSAQDILRADPSLLDIRFGELVHEAQIDLAIDPTSALSEPFLKIVPTLRANPDLSFYQVSQMLNVQPEHLLDELISFKDLTQSERAIDRFRKKERIRTNALSHLKKTGTFAKAFQGADLSSFSTDGEVYLSVPPSLYKSPQELQAVFKALQRWVPNLQFLVSLSRESKNFKKDVSLLESLTVAPHLISGIDLTGSINETTEGLDPEFKTFLSLLFNTIEKRQWCVRFHAFEGSREGTFYDSLWKNLSEHLFKIPQIRIGHIPHLTNRDLLELQKLITLGNNAKLNPSGSVKSRIIFEANVESNTFLQSTPPDRIAMTIRQLQRLGYTVVLGTDGANPLNTSLSGGLREIAPFLSRSELKEIWFNTVPHTVKNTETLVQILKERTAHLEHPWPSSRVRSWRKTSKERTDSPRMWRRQGR